MVGALAHRNRKIAQYEKHLKYVQVLQRSSEYDARKSQRSVVKEARAQIALMRASPYDLCRMCQEDGLLSDLEGVPCFLEACQKKKPIT